ncbi:MAG: rhodanese-like domain-containing protein [Lachnospiraceae bacterium]|nr:rhodanese-like domain-containing protein [Lachnospiraceae bacterium]
MEKIIPLKAKFIMDENEDAVVLDVRNLDEYVMDGHISGAMLIPLPDLRERAATELPDKDVPILVYCKSGGRSVKAAAILDELGYTQVKDFGGIKDWPFEIER